MKRARAGWATTKSKFADASSGVSLDPKLVTVIEASFASTSWCALQSHLADPHVSTCVVACVVGVASWQSVFKLACAPGWVGVFVRAWCFWVCVRERGTDCWALVVVWPRPYCGNCGPCFGVC